MNTQNLLRRLFLLRSPPRAAQRVFSTAPLHASEAEEEQQNCVAVKWFALPPYTGTASAAILGKRIAGAEKDSVSLSEASESTALKWIVRCCPDIPRNLVQKLFRLRQVRRECSETEGFDAGDQPRKPGLRRVGAKDSLNLGDRILLPRTVKKRPVVKKKCFCGEDEIGFVRSLVLHKDSEIIVVNKPPGLPVQGGIGIRTSLDELAISCLSYGSPEPPRLVHRLDKDCSGILVMGRTQTSATILHSIFREKTFGASNDETVDEPRALTRKYWALVFGYPRRSKGLISAPLAKVVLDNGKADRITVVNNSLNSSSQHAVTEYKVIGTSSHGYTWLELSPLTGRKHQLRVHCAEVLGTPIVGDYKYGWQAHRNWKPLCLDGPESKGHQEEILNMKNLPFGLNLENGSVTEKQPRLHLHCKQLVLPNISKALEHAKLRPDCDLSHIQSLEFDAPMPLYMQTSWDVINSQGTE